MRLITIKTLRLLYLPALILLIGSFAHASTPTKTFESGKKGKVTGPGSMAGYTILSIAGYAPDFVRSFALADWALPADVKIAQSAQVLSALRRAVEAFRD